MSQQSEDILYIKIQELANQIASRDNKDFMVDNYAGGNIDDAYGIGFIDGQIILARELLDLIHEE